MYKRQRLALHLDAVLEWANRAGVARMHFDTSHTHLDDYLRVGAEWARLPSIDRY